MSKVEFLLNFFKFSRLGNSLSKFLAKFNTLFDNSIVSSLSTLSTYKV